MQAAGFLAIFDFKVPPLPPSLSSGRSFRFSFRARAREEEHARLANFKCFIFTTGLSALTAAANCIT